ncbi:MAG: oxaloacetate decarboxylase [Desulfobacula sp.]|uniref:isocitrate lyase/PEP mutase family protein n=1 Tax=Desulfobacula sp. TaxID=2593537 RepID=UPI001D499643|nr:oxaloacetate decarboxylase [Deltaproteobacteria bacterium]MBT3487006.1 oxaloacetate decarboxylase [Desulfobacula sp.]MBT4025880.1 oxaloacetate decarboxylase [Desulfobacula sp.]MBT4878083.1 oxaloacetate decarboxylase [Desulfobacula sp.]MBT5545514.1 oxaloacetate decarboxylase [Desulfobacula sp.]
MKRTSLLQNYILEDSILVMPGAHDVLTAKIVEQAGFKALTIGGYSASASLLGQPDLSFLTLTEMVDCVHRIVDVVDIPVFTDGDTGHGGVLNVRRTVREIERTGAAGMFIEDQVFPKRCGHMLDKQVIGKEEMIAKVKAAVDARVDDDFVIMARTDALAVNGLEDAIERANLFSQAGADLIFVEAPTTVEQMRAITAQVDAPLLANNIEGGKSPLLSAIELEKIGYNTVVFPVAATYAIAKVVGDLMAEIAATGTTAGFSNRMVSFDEFNHLIGLDSLRSLERNYFHN